MTGPILFTPVQPGPGLISTMRKPEGGGVLPAAMTALAGAGVAVLVSALEPQEEIDLDLVGEADAAVAAGLTFLRAPIPDWGVPQTDLRPLLDDMRGHMLSGDHVVVHCWGGIGRSSMLAGAVLARSGIPVATIWATLSAARGRSVPETDSQRAWVIAQLRGN